jgi:hypothetical protein
MECTKLSHRLLDLRFFSVLGTSEHPGMSPEECHVKCGNPNVWDANNGVMVVYDELGRPWIMHGSMADDRVRRGLDGFQLSRGAYVPHSNDGGYFVREVAMKLIPQSVTVASDQRLANEIEARLLITELLLDRTNQYEPFFDVSANSTDLRISLRVRVHPEKEHLIAYVETDDHELSDYLVQIELIGNFRIGEGVKIPFRECGKNLLARRDFGAFSKITDAIGYQFVVRATLVNPRPVA